LVKRERRCAVLLQGKTTPAAPLRYDVRGSTSQSMPAVQEDPQLAPLLGYTTVGQTKQSQSSKMQSIIK